MIRDKQFLSEFDIDLAAFKIEVRHIQSDYTRERIREYFASHPGATSKDAAKTLGLSISTLGHYRSSLRKDWPK